MIEMATHALPMLPVITTLLVGGAATGGAFGLAVKLYDRWATHVAVKRQQTDDMALSVVEQMRDQMARDRAAFERELNLLRAEINAERQSCEAQLSVIRHRLANELTHSDALELAIRAAPDRAIETIDLANELRRKRAAEMVRAEHGAARQYIQSTASRDSAIARAVNEKGEVR